MFACLVDEMSSMEENIGQCSTLGSLDLRNMKIKIKMLLKPNIAKLVEEDNDDALEEVLMGERNLETVTSSKKGKKKKKNCSMETDEFLKLAKRVLHYACVLDSVRCCSLLLGSEKFTPVDVDAVDEADQCSGLHFASYYHSHRCVDLLLKKGANPSLLNWHSRLALEEALWSPSLDVDWDLSTDASEIVKRIGEKDLKVLKQIGIKCNCKDTLAALALKLAKGLALVPLVSLLHVRRSIINVVIRGSESDIQAGETIVDYMLRRVLPSSPPTVLDGKSQKFMKCKTVNLEENGVSEMMKSRNISGAWDDDNPEIKSRKDIAEVEEINSKHCSNSSQTDTARKNGSLARDCDALSGKSKDNYDSRSNCRLTRKILECILQFVQSWSAHSKNSLPPLIRAVQANDDALLDVLLASAAPVNDTDQDGNTALHWALKQATPLNGCSVNCSVVEKLLDAGATVTSGNNTGATPVHTAAGHGHLEALLLIIKKHGGSINILTGTRETPLHYAVKNNHLACGALLLKHGANRDVKSLRNQKPVQLARSSEMSALLSLDDKVFLDEACDNIITSQSCILSYIKQSLSGFKYSHSQKLCGTDSMLPGSLSTSKHVSTLQPVTHPENPPMSKSFSQIVAEAPRKFQVESSSQFPSSNGQESEQATNLTWQMVQKKPRKHINSSDSASNVKEIPVSKTVTLPPYKSVLCRFYGTNKKCEWGTNCHFAHSEEELRKGQQVLALFGQKVETIHGSAVSSNISDGVKNYKIKLCMHYEKNGTCPNGSKCKFAHGHKELRPISASSSLLSGARVGNRPSTASSLGSYSSEEFDDVNSRKVFVGGLPPYVNGRELREFMEGEFGKVIDSTVICGNDEDGVIRSRGFGFVLFEKQKDTDEAVRRHYIPFQGKRVELKKVMTRSALAAGDEVGKQNTLSLGLSSPATTQASRPSPSSSFRMLDDGLPSPGSDAVGYHWHLTQPSSSVELPQSLVGDGLESLQPFTCQPAGYLLENNKLIPKSEQIKDYQNNSDIFPAIHENCMSSITNEFYPFSQDTEHSFKSDDALYSSSLRSYGLSSSPTPTTMPSTFFTPFSNSNKCTSLSSSQPFTYFSSVASDCFFSTMPEASGSSQINVANDDKDLSQMLELLGVSSVPEPTEPKSFASKAPASNCGVSRAVPEISFHNGWEGDTLASHQNWDSQFWYGENWYGSAPQKTEYESQISGGSRCYYMPEKTGPSNFSGDFCYNGLLPEGFGFGEDYQISVGSQGPPRVSPALNESSHQRYATGKGHFQGFNTSHETSAYDLRQLKMFGMLN